MVNGADLQDVSNLHRMRFRLIVPVMVLLLAGCSTAIPDDATGEEVFVAVCARCHGTAANGDGIGPALNAGSEAADKDDEALLLTITRGRGRMPTFESRLTDDQISRVLDYLRELQAGE